jgi:hypothetical protein
MFKHLPDCIIEYILTFLRFTIFKPNNSSLPFHQNDTKQLHKEIRQFCTIKCVNSNFQKMSLLMSYTLKTFQYYNMCSKQFLIRFNIVDHRISRENLHEFMSYFCQYRDLDYIEDLYLCEHLVFKNEIPYVVYSTKDIIAYLTINNL